MTSVAVRSLGLALALGVMLVVQPKLVVAGDLTSRPAKGVVELFTSQGCLSCPPADRAFETLSQQPDVIALAYHVDYWNYRGWADTLGSPGNTARQYAYARSFGRNGVYTPQAVINGREQMKGTDAEALSNKIQGFHAAGEGLVVPIVATVDRDELSIHLGTGTGSGRADVLVVYFKQRKDVEVLKGENKGKRFTYRNSVTDIQSVGMWNGKPMDLTLPTTALTNGASDGFAILLQAARDGGDPGEIIGAAMVTVPPTQ